MRACPSHATAQATSKGSPRDGLLGGGGLRRFPCELGTRVVRCATAGQLTATARSAEKSISRTRCFARRCFEGGKENVRSLRLSSGLSSLPEATLVGVG